MVHLKLYRPISGNPELVGHGLSRKLYGSEVSDLFFRNYSGGKEPDPGSALFFLNTEKIESSIF